MKLLFFLIFLGVGLGQAAAQYDDEVVDTAVVDKEPVEKSKKRFKLDNFFIGSTYRLAFGRILLFDVAPYVGYRLLDRVALGVGVPYMYYYDGSNQRGSHIYGVRSFLRLRPVVEGPFSVIYFHAELERLNLDIANPNYNPSVPNSGVSPFIRSSATAANVGLGYTNQFAKGFGATVEFLYNALYVSGQSIFNSPFVYRFGIYYGF